MAVVVFLDGHRQIVNGEQGVAIWRVLNGEVEPTEQQADYCREIRDLYLNLREAPQSYFDKYPHRRPPSNDAVHVNQTSMFPKKQNRV